MSNADVRIAKVLDEIAEQARISTLFEELTRSGWRVNRARAAGDRPKALFGYTPDANVYLPVVAATHPDAATIVSRDATDAAPAWHVECSPDTPLEVVLEIADIVKEYGVPLWPVDHDRNT